MTKPLSEIAIEAAEQLEKQPGVNGVIVIVMHCTEQASMSGSAFRAPGLPVDHVIANAIEALSLLRQNARTAVMAAASASPSPPAGPANPGSSSN